MLRCGQVAVGQVVEEHVPVVVPVEGRVNAVWADVRSRRDGDRVAVDLDPDAQELLAEGLGEDVVVVRDVALDLLGALGRIVHDPAWREGGPSVLWPRGLRGSPGV